jgi:hypothetical protein
MPFTELFCSSGSNLGSAISFAQTHWVPCRFSAAIHATTLLWMRFCTNCPTCRKQGSLLSSAGNLATLACPAMRPLMLQLKRLLCTETWLLIELSAVMFALSSIVLFYRHGKMNGLTVREANCDWWSYSYRRGVLFSAVLGRRKLFSHGCESATQAWHMVMYFKVSLLPAVITVATHRLCHTRAARLLTVRRSPPFIPS